MKAMRGWLHGLAVALVVSLASAQATLPANQILLDIQPQSLLEALNAWAQQTGMQVIVPEDAAANAIVSQGVRGRYTAQQALEILLAGTSLTYTLVNSRTVAIGIHSAAALRAPAHIEESSGLRRSAATLVSLEKITVTGSRLPNDDIRADGSVDTPAPVNVFDRQHIDRLGVSTVGELMKYVSQQPFKQFEGSNLSGAEHAELRGAGVDSTLVLINGRRTVPSSNTASLNAFDLNTIPVSAVDRVEILSDSAAAVYGADAIGGVVNVIFKNSLPHTVLDLQSGSADGGAGERRASVSGSHSKGRFRSLAVLDYYDRASLTGSERDRWRNQDYRRYGGSDQRIRATNPANVSALSGNLPGLSSGIAVVPDGSTGVGLTPSDFVATAGRRNWESPFKYATIIPETERRSLMALADFGIARNVSAFGEFLYTRRETHFGLPPITLDNVVVPESNAYNPFGTDVAVDYLLTGVSREAEITSTLRRLVGGVRGTLGAWDWELSALSSEEESDILSAPRLDALRLSAALASSTAESALNVFRDGPGGSEELLSSLLTPPQQTHSASSGSQGAAVLRGPLGNLPAGPVEMVLGTEWLHSSIHSNDNVDVRHGRTAGSGFAELRVPLIDADMDVGAVQSLALTLAARHDHYSDFGDSFNPQYGVVWRPVPDVLLRASYGTSFRAPSIFELYARQEEFAGLRIADPRRNNEPATITLRSGGNPDLDPIRAHSFAAGFVFTPGSIDGLKLSSTYWRVKAINRVTGLVPGDLLANEERFADRIVRAPASDPGLPGVLQALDVTRMNFGSLETSGIDGAAEYAFDSHWGRFWQNLSATWVSQYTGVDASTASKRNTVGIASGRGSVLRWRANAMLGWSMRGIGASVAGRFSPAYQDVDPLSGRLTGREVDAKWLLDLQATLDVNECFGDGRAWRPALRLTAGVSNLLDEEPSFSEITYGQGFDASQGDLRQRFAYLRLSASF